MLTAKNIFSNFARVAPRILTALLFFLALLCSNQASAENPYMSYFPGLWNLIPTVGNTTFLYGYDCTTTCNYNSSYITIRNNSQGGVSGGNGFQMPLDLGADFSVDTNFEPAYLPPPSAVLSVKIIVSPEPTPGSNALQCDYHRSDGAIGGTFAASSSLTVVSFPYRQGRFDIQCFAGQKETVTLNSISIIDPTLPTPTPTPPPQSIQISLSDVNVSQTVNNPRINGDSQNVALVANKTFAVSMTVHAKFSDSSLASRRFHAEVTYDSGVVAKSQSFALSGVDPNGSKLFMFLNQSISGGSHLRIGVVADSPDSTYGPTQVSYTTIPVKFYEANLSVLFGQITGCRTGSCFSAPTADDLSSFAVQKNLANQLLPVSGSGVSYQNGSNVVDSNPTGILFLQRTRDWVEIWENKHAANKNLAVYLVNSSYMQKMGYESEEENYGITPPFLHISIIDGRSPITLTHEMIHALGNFWHSGVPQVSGINVGTKTAFGLNQKLLIPNVSIFSFQAYNAFYANPLSDDPSLFLVDDATYASVLQKILSPSYDPKAILISGAVDSQGRVVWSSSKRMQTMLDESTGADIEVRGLDSSGNIVSSIATAAVSQYEVLGKSGSTTKTLPGYMFATTLPDTGNITRVQVVKSGKTVFTYKVAEPNTLSELVSRLIHDDFKSNRLATAELSILRDEVRKYSMLIGKRRTNEAKATLVLIKMTANLVLKPSFNLSDGSPYTLTEFNKMIDSLLASLK